VTADSPVGRRTRCILVPMNTAFAVALVTALSTLFGVAISGTITLLITRNQGKTQLALADSSRTEQRSRDRRQTRRDAYVQFLNQVSLIEQELDKCWVQSSPITDVSFVKDPSAIPGQLDPLVNLVFLEGPDSLAIYCQVLETKLVLEAAKIVMLFNESGAKQPMGLHNDDSYVRMRLERGMAKNKVIKQARLALSDISGSAGKAATGGDKQNVKDALDSPTRMNAAESVPNDRATQK
jgi:hypothetical protein